MVKKWQRHFKGTNHLSDCLDLTVRVKNLFKVESKDISLGGQARGECILNAILADIRV